MKLHAFPYAGAAVEKLFFAASQSTNLDLVCDFIFSIKMSELNEAK